MLGRIIALIIILPVGLFAVLVVSAVASTDMGIVSYGTGPFTTYGPSPIPVLAASSLLILVGGGLILLGLVWVMMRLVNVPGREPRGAGYGHTDTQLIQELHHIATRLEARIEALETIMLERERSGVIGGR